MQTKDLVQHQRLALLARKGLINPSAVRLTARGKGSIVLSRDPKEDYVGYLSHRAVAHWLETIGSCPRLSRKHLGKAHSKHRIESLLVLGEELFHPSSEHGLMQGWIAAQLCHQGAFRRRNELWPPDKFSLLGNCPLNI